MSDECVKEYKEVEKLTDEEFKSILDANTARINSLAIAEKAALEAKVSSQQYQIIVQHVFLKYGLKTTDIIDDKTGVITRKYSDLGETKQGV